MATMPKILIEWEYKVIIETYDDVNPPSLPDRLQELGRDGWEAFSIQYFAPVTGIRYQMVLKRARVNYA